MDKLLSLLFTEHRIIRKLSAKHTVYQINTGIQPEVDYDKDGKIKWNTVIESLSNDKKRNDMILQIVKKFDTRVFLIMCKRTSQAKYLYDKLCSVGESVSLYIESSTEYDKDARILIGTVKKVGVGFNHPRLNALIAAIDLEAYFIQYLGRIFRTTYETTELIVFDIVDDHSVLKRHYKSREKVYKETGGTIIPFAL